MKILVIYATKTGTVNKCLDELKKYLPQGDFTFVNIVKEECGYNLSDFDSVVLGSSIRMNKIHKNLCAFISENEKEICKSKHALFLCLGFTELFDEYVTKNFPESVRDSAFAISCFGGEMDISKQKGIDKFLMKIVRNDIMGGGNNGQPREDMTLPTINEGNISQLAEMIKGI